MAFTEWRDSEQTYARCGNTAWSFADGRAGSSDLADWAAACEGAGVEFLEHTGGGTSWDVYGSDGTFHVSSGIDVLDVQYFLDHPPDLVGVYPYWDTQFLTDPRVTGVEWEEPQGTRLDQWRANIDSEIFVNDIDPADVACVFQVRRGNASLYTFNGLTLDSYRSGALPLRGVDLSGFLTGATLNGLFFEFGHQPSAPSTYETFTNMVLFNDAELDGNGMISFAYGTSYQVNHTPPIPEAGSPTTRVYNGSTVITLDMLYQPPRYRLVLAGIPPLRQWPRDDGLRRTPRGTTTGSRQGSLRRGPRGNYT